MSLSIAWESFLESIPKAGGAIIVLIVGWTVGRIVGRAVSTMLERSGLDDLLKRTIVGRAIIRSGIKPVRFFDLLIRWFIYLVAIFVAVEMLHVEILSRFMLEVVEYIPNLIAGIAILIFGFIAADFLGEAVSALAEEAKILFYRIVGSMVKLILYFIVVTIALSQMKIDVKILYIFANAIAWGMAAGITIGLGIALGWGLKDVIAKSASKWFPSLEETAKHYEEKFRKNSEASNK